MTYSTSVEEVGADEAEADNDAVHGSALPRPILAEEGGGHGELPGAPKHRSMRSRQEDRPVPERTTCRKEEPHNQILDAERPDVVDREFG
eukprot:CAMPEP_0195117206 /NCGR_PEP_ID=MMETSP0448-20130528/113855_1 /TAXON_ID=66468 /ORGANISM="Heterocapsa triquestra, Strain CCMP 448" /LENGTH=89 /DNA_ID=CAMNT_0040154417 /DNA_START=165 /DNA_END=435 /DNA_ORIENTATION=-